MSDDSDDANQNNDEEDGDSAASTLKNLIKSGDVSGVLCMLETGDIWPECLNEQRFANLLTTAATYGQTKILDMLLCRGFRQPDDILPLHVACKRGHTEIVKLLFEKWNANLTSPDSRGRLPLYYAIVNDQFDTVKCLVELGADVNKGTIMSPLLLSVINYKPDICKFLIENGADFDTKDYYGRSPLTAAARGAKNNIVLMLLKAGADVNLCGRHATPFQAACMAGHVSTAKILVDHGADMNLSDADGDTALHLAVLNGHYRTVRYLVVELNLNPYKVNNSHQTALDFAIENVDVDMLFLFRDAGYMRICEVISSSIFNRLNDNEDSFRKYARKLLCCPFSLQELVCFKVRHILSVHRKKISPSVANLLLPQGVRELIELQHIPYNRGRKLQNLI